MLKFTALSLLLSLSPALLAATVRVTVSDQVAGRTPEIIGYNIGSMLPGSNVATWLDYTGANGARVWWTPQRLEMPDGSYGRAAATVQSEADFAAARQALRDDPLGSVDWEQHAQRLARWFGDPDADSIGGCRVLDQLARLGITPLAVVSRTHRRAPLVRDDGSTNWQEWWSRWSYVYAQVFYLGRHYGIERIQLFNEPDHSSSLPLSQEEYLALLRAGSDAAQAAIADVNARFGKQLQARISAPVTTGMHFRARPGRPDTRDAEQGWGELAMANRTKHFPGQTDTFAALFQHYGFHTYSRDPVTLGQRFSELRKAVKAANQGSELPFVVTETNVSTAANFARTEETLDSPSFYSAAAPILAGYINHGIDEIYVFKLTRTANLDGGEVKKNGTHWVANGAPLESIGGSSRGAEAFRLVMRGFGGGLVRLAAPDAGGSSIATIAARSEDHTRRTLLVANPRGAPAAALTIDLKPWQLPAGSLMTIEEVNEERHGAVAFAGPAPVDGELQLALPVAGSALIRFDQSRPAEPRQVLPEAAVTLRGGLLAAPPPIGASLRVRSDAEAPGQTETAALFFPAEAIAELAGRRVFLSLTAAALGGAADAIAHVYAAPVNAWGEAAVGTAPVPWLSFPPGVHRDIEPNCIDATAPGLRLLGTLRAGAAPQLSLFEATAAVDAAKGRGLVFVVVRESRYKGDSDGGLALANRADTGGPVLIAY
jgi:hypothetical protein